MNFNSSRIVKSLMPVALCVCVATSVQAQTDSLMLEEVVVTAQKREQNLSEIPVAVTAISGDAIANAGAIGIENISQMVPSLSFGKGGTNRNSNLSLRGVGTISFSVGAEPSVSTIVDNVVMARAGQAFSDLFDIERIEVLRGPQGTLFGKNASSGVVNIISKGPSEEFEAGVDVSLYEDNERRIRGMVSGPITEQLAYRINVFDGDFDGFVENAFNGDDIYGYDRQGLRLMLDWAPTDSFNARLIYDYYEAEDECCSEVVIVDDGGIQSAAFQQGGGEIDGFETRTTASNALQLTENESNGVSLQLDWDFENFTLTSITAWREWDNVERQDIEDTPFGSSERDGDSHVPGDITLNSVDGLLVGLNTARDFGPQTWEQSSQEFRITSTGGGSFEWQLGAFIWHSEVDRTFARYDALCVDDPTGVTGGIDLSGLAEGDVCPASNIQLPSAEGIMEVEFDNWAIFGQATYHLTDDTGVTVGLRYVDDEVSYTHSRERFNDNYVDLLGNNNGNNNDDGGVFALQVDKGVTTDTTTENDVSGKVALHHNFTDAMMGYVSVATGYKGPAFNVFFNMRDPDNLPPINAETSTALELGFKWQLDAAVFSMAIFRQEYSDFQANSFILTAGAVTTNLTNAGDVTSEGLEFEFIAQASEHLNIFGGVTLANAEIDEFDCSLQQNIGEPCSERAGEDLPFSPKVKGSIAAEYVIPLNSMELIINSNVAFQSESFAAQSEPEEQKIDAYSLFNTSVALSWKDDMYRLSLHGKNLFDEAYVAAYNEGGRVARLPRDGERYFGVAFRANF